MIKLLTIGLYCFSFVFLSLCVSLMARVYAFISCMWSLYVSGFFYFLLNLWDIQLMFLGNVPSDPWPLILDTEYKKSWTLMIVSSLDVYHSRTHNEAIDFPWFLLVYKYPLEVRKSVRHQNHVTKTTPQRLNGLSWDFHGIFLF